MVPELETLERYIAGEMNSSEREVLESMLKEDPMLADAIDGLKEVGDVELVRSSLARLYRGNRERLLAKAKKRELLSKRKSRVHIMNNQPLFMGIAAGLVILIVSVFVIRRMNKAVEPTLNPAIAHQGIQENIPPIVAPDTLKSEDESEESLSQPEKLEKKKPELIADHFPPSPKDITEAKLKPKSLDKNALAEEPTQSKVLEEVDMASGKEEYFDDFVLEDETSTDTSSILEGNLESIGKKQTSSTPPIHKEIVRINDPTKGSKQREFLAPTSNNNSINQEKRYQLLDPLPLPDDTIRIGPDLSAPPAISRTDSVYIGYYKKPGKYDKDKGMLLKAQAMTDLLYQGVEALRINDIVLARDKFEEVLKSSGKNVTAHFYLGKTELQAGNYKGAVKNFRHNLDYPAAPLYDENKWFLAQAYLKAGKSKAVRRLLEEIVTSESPYRDQALSLLKDLE